MGIQLIIGFLDLFKGSLGQNSERLLLGLRAEHRELRLLLWFSSMIVRLISRLSCSELGKINDHKYMLI